MSNKTKLLFAYLPRNKFKRFHVGIVPATIVQYISGSVKLAVGSGRCYYTTSIPKPVIDHLGRGKEVSSVTYTIRGSRVELKVPTEMG